MKSVLIDSLYFYCSASQRTAIALGSVIGFLVVIVIVLVIVVCLLKGKIKKLNSKGGNICPL